MRRSLEDLLAHADELSPKLARKDLIRGALLLGIELVLHRVLGLVDALLLCLLLGRRLASRGGAILRSLPFRDTDHLAVGRVQSSLHVENEGIREKSVALTLLDAER